MLRRQVGIFLHHFQRLPASQLLQYEQGRAGSDMPARPGVPQVMDAEILDTGCDEGPGKNSRASTCFTGAPVGPARHQQPNAYQQSQAASCAGAGAILGAGMSAAAMFF